MRNTESLITPQRRTARRAIPAIALALSSMLVSCSGDTSTDDSEPTTTTTTIKTRHGQVVGPSLQTLLDTAELTGHTVVQQGDTGIDVHCFDTRKITDIASGTSYNELAKVGLTGALIEVRVKSADQPPEGQTIYEVFNPGLTGSGADPDTLATRLQDDVAAANGQIPLQPGETAVTFGQCVITPFATPPA